MHAGDILRDSIGVAAFHYLLYKAVPEYRPALALLRIYMYTMNQRAPGTELDNMLREIYANAWRNMHHEYSEKTMQEKFFL